MRRIKLAFYLNMTFALVELIGVIIIGSFAIIADAIHDFGAAPAENRLFIVARYPSTKWFDEPFRLC